MIGTEDGLWFSLERLENGRVHYEFYRDEVKLDEAECSTSAMVQRFAALEAAVRRPLC